MIANMADMMALGAYTFSKNAAPLSQFSLVRELETTGEWPLKG